MQIPALLHHFWIAASIAIIVLPGSLHAEAGPKPASAGPEKRSWQELAVERARILSHVKWTPVADTMPVLDGGFFKQGQEYTGIPYSSVGAEGRIVGFDIGVRTFLAAVENPLSVLYTVRDMERGNAAAFYGTVCSGYTSYALQCAVPEVARHHSPEVKKGVVLANPQSAESAQVGDVIFTPPAKADSPSHVELVTAVTRDENGRVTSVRIEESTPPTTKITDRSVENFNKHLAKKNKQLLHITNMDEWRGANRADALRFPNYEADATTPAINRTLLLDLGDWVPYRKGQPVKFNIMDRDALGVKKLVIQRGNEVVEEIALTGPGVLERNFDTTGDYTAHVVRPDGSSSQACEFAVCDINLSLPEGSVPIDEEWKIGFTSENMDVIAVYLVSNSDRLGRHPLIVTEEQRRLGFVTVPAGLLKKEGNLQVWLSGEHPLGRLKVRKDVQMVSKSLAEKP